MARKRRATLKEAVNTSRERRVRLIVILDGEACASFLTPTLQYCDPCCCFSSRKKTVRTRALFFLWLIGSLWHRARLHYSCFFFNSLYNPTHFCIIVYEYCLSTGYTQRCTKMLLFPCFYARVYSCDVGSILLETFHYECFFTHFALHHTHRVS